MPQTPVEAGAPRVLVLAPTGRDGPAAVALLSRVFLKERIASRVLEAVS